MRAGDNFWRICDVDTDPIHAASQPPSNECIHLFIHSITFSNIWAYVVLKTEHGFVKGEAWALVRGGWRVLGGSEVSERLPGEVGWDFEWATFPLWTQDASSRKQEVTSLPSSLLLGATGRIWEYRRVCWRVWKAQKSTKPGKCTWLSLER